MRTVVLHPVRSKGEAREPGDALAEAVSLADALDLDVVAKDVVPLPRARAGTLFGKGKLEELGRLIAEREIGLVIVDGPLSPVQQRNLEKAWKAKLLDRTGLILEIFGDRAHTREGVLQVELAHLSYQKSRLVRSWTHLERQRGGFGFLGGPGEAQIETDRRLIDERIAAIRKELTVVVRTRTLHRAGRSRVPIPVVALVGYTNAGKSSLMRALTGDEVYVADQLFATLDTTVRALKPETRPRILVSDTVGFIKKLPHDLVASFRSTLEEAKEASLLLHVVDASDPAWRDQYAVTREVLAQIGAVDNTSLLVLNKADRLSEGDRAALRAEFPEAVLMSARSADDVARLHGRLVAFFERDMQERSVLIPYGQERGVALLHERCRVLEESYDEQGTRVRVRAPASLLDSLAKELQLSFSSAPRAEQALATEHEP